MLKPIIRILEPEPNRRGDLFTRRVSEMFPGLGYDHMRKNVLKAGREIDLEGTHRTECRRVLVECKATERPIGGDDLRKFVGVSPFEEDDSPPELYFVSLAGFTESAIEMVKRAKRSVVHLVDGAGVVRELIAGKILEAPEVAAHTAGRLLAQHKLEHLELVNRCELLAHESGWYWALYCGQHRQATHFALLHGDGGLLSESVAAPILQADRAVGGDLYTLSYLAPLTTAKSPTARMVEVMEQYRKYLAYECGEIHLAGLPVDERIGARPIKLEKIYVPLRLVGSRRIPNSDPWESLRLFIGRGVPDHEMVRELRSAIIAASPYSAMFPRLRPSDEGGYRGRGSLQTTYTSQYASGGSTGPFYQTAPEEGDSVGCVLGREHRIAILAPPGGGKSTLLKRLAIGYAFPERRAATEDDLPDENWLPIFIRCRHLGTLVREPITDIIWAIAKRAEFPTLSDAWREVTEQALRDGQVLLLIDGLDEITDDRERAAFGHQLRTFLARYTQIRVVVTSRPAGFRAVGGSLAGHCQEYDLAEFSDADIRAMTATWYREVVGDRAENKAEAISLADVICKTDRVRRLATNPLLLTVLLLVKRRVGKLPTKRSRLYREAMAVLLDNWNSEVFEPLDQEEVLPQVGFVALAMMRDGVQRITESRLRDLLEQARVALPGVGFYTTLTIPELIRRVELRSSILIMGGRDEATGERLYEFRHLTFQEYLAALAVVKRYCPAAEQPLPISTLLEPHLDDEAWKEVIPLVVVQAEHEATRLMEWLTQMTAAPGSGPRRLAVLGQCMLDEPHLHPEAVVAPLHLIATRTRSESLITQLGQSRFGVTFRQVLMEGLAAYDHHFFGYAAALSALHRAANLPNLEKRALLVADHTSSRNWEPVLGELLALTDLISTPRLAGGSVIWEACVRVMTECNTGLRAAACWALGILAPTLPPCPLPLVPKLVPQLITSWHTSPLPEVSNQAARVLIGLPLIEPSLISIADHEERLGAFVQDQFRRHRKAVRTSAQLCTAVFVAFYLGRPWTLDKFQTLVLELSKVGGQYRKAYRRLLSRLPYPTAFGRPRGNTVWSGKKR